MTLKDKFEQWFINDEEDEHYEGMVDKVAIEHERIADEYAIEFAYWLFEDMMKITKVEKLLKLFKQSKGL
jgi:hypothetical protein